MSLADTNVHIKRLHTEAEVNHQIPWSIHCAIQSVVPRVCPNMVSEDVSRVASAITELMTGVDTGSVQFVEALTREQARQRKLKEIEHDRANNIEDAEFKDVEDTQDETSNEKEVVQEVVMSEIVDDVPQ